MRHRNIVIITTGLDNGGAELALYNLLSKLKHKSNTNYHVISLSSIGPVGIRLKKISVSVTAINLKSDLAFISVFRFIRLIYKIKPVQIHGWMYHGNLFAFIGWIFNPYSLLFFNIRQALHSLYQEKVLTRFVIIFNALLSRFCELVIHNSQVGIMHHENVGFYTRNSMYIPNGFDLEMLSPSDSKRECFRSQYKISRLTRVITLLARYDPIKGHDVFLEAAKILLQEKPEVIFLMAGEGLSPDHPELSGLISQIASNLIVLGHQDDVSSVLNGSDILTVCSHSEGFPNALGEAMSGGLVCVATDVGGCSQILGDCGRIAPPAEPASLAQCWLELLSLPESEFRKNGLKARQRIKDCFSADKFVDSYLRIFLARKS